MVFAIIYKILFNYININLINILLEGIFTEK